MDTFEMRCQECGEIFHQREDFRMHVLRHRANAAASRHWADRNRLLMHAMNGRQPSNTGTRGTQSRSHSSGIPLLHYPVAGPMPTLLDHPHSPRTRDGTNMHGGPIVPVLVPPSINWSSLSGNDMTHLLVDNFQTLTLNESGEGSPQRGRNRPEVGNVTSRRHEPRYVGFPRENLIESQVHLYQPHVPCDSMHRFHPNVHGLTTASEFSGLSTDLAGQPPISEPIPRAIFLPRISERSLPPLPLVRSGDQQPMTAATCEDLPVTLRSRPLREARPPSEIERLRDADMQSLFDVVHFELPMSSQIINPRRLEGYHNRLSSRPRKTKKKSPSGTVTDLSTHAPRNNLSLSEVDRHSTFSGTTVEKHQTPVASTEYFDQNQGMPVPSNQQSVCQSEDTIPLDNDPSCIFSNDKTNHHSVDHSQVLPLHNIRESSPPQKPDEPEEPELTSSRNEKSQLQPDTHPEENRDFILQADLPPSGEFCNPPESNRNGHHYATSSDLRHPSNCPAKRQVKPRDESKFQRPETSHGPNSQDVPEFHTQNTRIFKRHPGSQAFSRNESRGRAVGRQNNEPDYVPDPPVPATRSKDKPDRDEESPGAAGTANEDAKIERTSRLTTERNGDVPRSLPEVHRAASTQRTFTQSRQRTYPAPTPSTLGDFLNNPHQFCCDVCGERFNKINHLQNHLKKKHPTEQN